MDGYSYGRMFDGIGNLIYKLFIAAVIMFPLALWKLIDIIIYISEFIYNHVSVVWP